MRNCNKLILMIRRGTLRCRMAMLTLGRRFLKNTGKKAYYDVRPLDLISPSSGYDWGDQAEERPTNFALMAYSSTSSNSEFDKCKTGLGYNVVPPPYTRNFMPPKPDLSFFGLKEFTSEPIVIKPVVENNEAKASEAKPKAVRKNNNAPIIEDWVSDNEEDDVLQAKIEKKTFKPSFAKIEFVKSKQQEKTARKTVNRVEQNRQNIHIPRGNQRN
ncbi:hypothetical protein Tco_1133682 [Tanacetum coccineum]